VSIRCVNEWASWLEVKRPGKRELSRLRAQFFREGANIRSCLCFLLHNIFFGDDMGCDKFGKFGVKDRKDDSMIDQICLRS
jgi:hypothetical protein